MTIQKDGPSKMHNLLIFDLCKDLLNNMHVIKRKTKYILYIMHVISHESLPHFTRPKTFKFNTLVHVFQFSILRIHVLSFQLTCILNDYYTIIEYKYTTGLLVEKIKFFAVLDTIIMNWIDK